MLCDETLRQQIKTRLQAFDVRADTDPEHRRAAVAVLVVEEGHGAEVPGLPKRNVWSNEAALMLTRRSEQLRNHPGQWAFPGGRVDPGETLIEAALRELEEEVGISCAQHDVLGVLDDFITRSGFAMTPVVVWGGTQAEPQPNPDEVASIHRIPVRELFREDAPLLEHLPEEEGGSEHPVLRMPIGDDHIAAPTAALIYQFREVCLAGRSTRVAHYEQPQFAWK